MYEHRCLENIKKLYNRYGKCNNKQHYNTIIEEAMVSTPDRGTDNNPTSSNQYVTVKIVVQENHSINFWKNWMSNKGLLSTDLVLPNQNSRQSEKATLFGQVFLSAVVIQNLSTFQITSKK